MTQRVLRHAPSAHHASAPSSAPPALETIDLGALHGVTGGRIVPRSTLDPVLLQGLQDLSQAIASVGQNLATAKQGASQQMMQIMQMMMQSRGR
jgi:hypothetical protein